MDITFARTFGVVFQNVMAMARDRGYEVPNLHPDPLAVMAGLYVKSKASGMSMAHEASCCLQHTSDASRSLGIWFLDRNYDTAKGRERMVSTDQIKAMHPLLAASAASEHVIISPNKLSPQAKRENIQVMAFDDLLIDLPRHCLALPHKVVSLQQMRSVLGAAVDPSQLPWLPKNDPMARWLGLQPGQVVFIDRPDLPSFRVVTS